MSNITRGTGHPVGPKGSGETQRMRPWAVGRRPLSSSFLLQGAGLLIPVSLVGAPGSVTSLGPRPKLFSPTSRLRHGRLLCLRINKCNS
jgi:hypothetical protein